MNDEWWKNENGLGVEQRTMMNLGLSENHLILGPPGCGKTNLLMLRAKYLALSGRSNVLVVVFGRVLKEFLLRGCDKYGIEPSKVTTSIKWLYDILREFGVPQPHSNRPFSEIRTELIEKARAAVLKHSGAPLYDAVLVDEAQDFSEDEIDVFCQIGKSIFAVGDSNQAIYSASTGLAKLESVCRVHRLTAHYRNGLQICRFADAIASSFRDHVPLVNSYQYPELKMESSVVFQKCGSFDEQMKHLVGSLVRQRAAYPRELIGVVCPLVSDVEKVFEHLQRTELGTSLVLQTHDSGYVDFNGEGAICLSTIHGTKGLEFRAVHCLGLESLYKFSFQRRLMFTLATRAKTALTIYSVGELPGYINSALDSLQPRHAPTIKDLFKEVSS